MKKLSTHMDIIIERLRQRPLIFVNDALSVFNWQNVKQGNRFSWLSNGIFKERRQVRRFGQIISITEEEQMSLAVNFIGKITPIRYRHAHC